MPVRPHIVNTSAPTWAEVWAFGDYIEARERWLRMRGAYHRPEHTVESHALAMEYKALRHAHHARHASALKFRPPHS